PSGLLLKNDRIGRICIDCQSINKNTEGRSIAYFNERLNGVALNYPTNDEEPYTDKLDLSGKYDIGLTFNVTDFSPFDTGGDSRTNPFEEGGNDMNLASLKQAASTTSIHPRRILTKPKYKRYPCLYMKKLKNKFGLDRTFKWVRNKFRIKVRLKSQFEILLECGPLNWPYLELQTSNWANSSCLGKITSGPTTFMKIPRPNSEFNTL